MSGNPPAPSFQAHWSMSIGSFDPPPVKIVEFGFASAVQATAFAPVVLEDVEQSLPVTWWQTLSQSSDVEEVAIPSSSNTPVSWTACAPNGNRRVNSNATSTGITKCRRPRGCSVGLSIRFMEVSPHPFRVRAWSSGPTAAASSPPPRGRAFSLPWTSHPTRIGELIEPVAGRDVNAE